MPERIRLAVEGKRCLVLRYTDREARDALDADRRLIEDAGTHEAVTEVKTGAGYRRITFASGGRIEYMGGDGLDERVRGMRVDHLDDAYGLIPRAKFFLTGSAS